jgi:SNF family Na+-dependent transporter
VITTGWVTTPILFFIMSFYQFIIGYVIVVFAAIMYKAAKES